jgi:hypothetical protein
MNTIPFPGCCTNLVPRCLMGDTPRWWYLRPRRAASLQASRNCDPLTCQAAKTHALLAGAGRTIKILATVYLLQRLDPDRFKCTLHRQTCLRVLWCTLSDGHASLNHLRKTMLVPMGANCCHASEYTHTEQHAMREQGG